MRHREITNEQVLTAFEYAEERDHLRKEFEQWRAERREQLRQWQAKRDEEWQQLRSELQDELRSEWQDELRTLIEENSKLQGENSKLRALCAELHEARGRPAAATVCCAQGRAR